jgi:anti-anti-sigma regulatory factor
VRITINEGPEVTTMKLEGRIVEPWIDEVRRAWRSLAGSLGARKLVVDLCGVTHASADGRQLLADMHHETQAEFIADSPMTKFFAEEARKAEGEAL